MLEPMQSPSASAQAPLLPWRPGNFPLIFGAWTLFAALISTSVLFDASGQPRAEPVPVDRIVITFIEAYLWAALTPLIFWLVRRFVTERYTISARLLIFTGVGIALAIAVGVVIQLLRVIFSRSDIAQPFPAVSGIGFAIEALTYTAVLTAGFARHYLARVQEQREQASSLQAQTVQLQAQLADARLMALRAQLNPHFLFNSLHAIAALTDRDPRGARRMLSRLSDLLRISLNETDGPETTLRRELDFVAQYLELMRIQLPAGIEFSQDVEAAAFDALVPTFLLQPLVENAFKHGLSKVSGPGKLSLVARRSGAELRILISNNGPAAHIAQTFKEGVGLRNTRERLARLYGEHQSLEFRAATQAGEAFITQMTLPFHADGLSQAGSWTSASA